MPSSFQILLSDDEKNRLLHTIENDFGSAAQSTADYKEQCRGWLQKWENRVDPPALGDEKKPNHTVPLTQWMCFQKLARDMQALLGDRAEITGRAVGPSDEAKVRKAGRYMTARMFDQMAITNPLCEFEFRRILFGHSVAYRPWWRREFDIKERGRIRRVCDYEGPGFFPCEPDDIVIPAERGITDIQDFSWVGYRTQVSIDDLRRGAGTEFQGTDDRDFLERAIHWARSSSDLTDWQMLDSNAVRAERERSDGVDYDNANSRTGRMLWIWWYYGKWRPLKKQKRDAEIDDIEKRLPYEADWRIGYIPGLQEIVCVQDLIDLYPRMRRRRPFVESSLVKDGSYRSKGFGRLLESLEDEATANSRLFQAAGELSVWPFIFFEPGGGFQPKAFKIEPGMATPTANASSVKIYNASPNMQFGIVRQQDILSNGERVVGITDQSMGRSSGRPNEPRTATGQLALLEAGNVRAWLDAAILREDAERMIGEFWEMESDLTQRRTKNGKPSKGVFFRVTEEQAGGLFDVAKGGAYMSPTEFGGKLDFRLKFATSAYAREAARARFMAFYQLASASPLCMNNPLALWTLLNRLAHEFEIDDFETIVPRPPELDVPKTPDKEWILMLEGEEVEVHPQDHDALHIQQHVKQIDAERQDPNGDMGAVDLAIAHLMKHKEQQRGKMLMQAQVTELAKSINQPDNPLGQALGQGLQEQEMEQQPAPGDNPAALM